MKYLTDLLHKPRREGYPVDFTLARLSSRLAGFATQCPIGGGKAAWQELGKEHRWLYTCLDHSLRKELAAVFLCFELRNINSAIRFARAGDREGTISMLASSMLSVDLKNVLLNSENLVTLLKALSARLSSLDQGFAGLDRVYLDHGLPAVEKTLLDGLLSAASRAGLSGPTNDFLARFVDRRDLLAMAKEGYWGLENFIPANIKDRATLRRLRRKSRAINTRIPGAAGEPVRLENILLEMTVDHFRRQSRTWDTIPKLLDHIMSCYLAARNCGVGTLRPAEVAEPLL